MTLTFPDIPSIPEDELRLELACGLYGSRRLARGVAAKLAGVDAETFEQALQFRGITNGYKASDLDSDLNALNQLLAITIRQSWRLDPQTHEALVVGRSWLGVGGGHESEVLVHGRSWDAGPCPCACF